MSDRELDLLRLIDLSAQTGDKATEQLARNAYQKEFTGLGPNKGIDTLSNKAMRYGKEVAYQTGNLLKNLGEGVVGTVGLVTDTPAMVYEALSGQQAPQWATPARSFVQGMEQLGGKELAPESSQYVSAPVQRVMGDVQRAVGGGIGGLGAGQMMTRSANPIIQGAGQVLASPRGAFAPAVTSSLAQGITRESGGGKGAQLAAALAGGLAPAGAAGALRSVSGIKPTPSAQLLISKGVDLTPGQLNKGGLIDQLETSFEGFPIIGQIIKAPKDKVEEDLRHALIQESAAPGAVIPKTGKSAEMLDAAYESFDPAYETVHGFPLVLQKGKPVIVNAGQNIPMEKALKSAISTKSVMATNDTRSMISDFINDQLTKPIKNSEDLLNIRSAIRTEIRGITAADADARARRLLLENAEDVVTKTLDSQLPPAPMQNLRAVDAKYANYKKLEDAIFRGGENFTLTQVESALKRGADKGVYARGGGSPLRPLVEAGKEITAQTLPQTGARLGPMLATAGLIGKKAGAIPAALISAGLVGTKTGRTLARGGYDWQNAAAARPLDYRTIQGLLETEKARRMANLLASQEQ